MIPIEERQLCTRATQNALTHFASRDLEKLLADLYEMENVFVYSNYSFYREWEKAKPQIVRWLFESLPFEEFLQFPAGKNFYKFEVIGALDELAPQMTVQQVQVLAEKYTFPRLKREPLLFQKLVDATEPQVTEWIHGHIESYLNEKREDLERNVPIYSTKLSERIAILARRSDDKALELCREYGKNLPWGKNLSSSFRSKTLFIHTSTSDLLDNLGEQNTEASREVIRDLVQFHREPSLIRLYLLGKLLSFQPREAFELAFQDLNAQMDTVAREGYLSWLERNSEKFALFAHEFIPKFEFVGWESVSRTMLFTIAKEKFPHWHVSLTWHERAMLAIIAIFERLRWNYEKMGYFLPFVVAGALIYLAVLSNLIGDPPKWMRWLNDYPFCSFIDLILLLVMTLNAMGSARWEGSVRESVRQKWDAAFEFLGWLLAFLVGTILVRIF